MKNAVLKRKPKELKKVKKMSKIAIIGAGLAGVEAAWQVAKEFEVDLYEMKPKKFSPAHSSENFAELVCSNSLKALRKGSAAGML